MKFAKTTLAVSLAAVLIGGFGVGTASAAVRDSYRISEDSAGNFYRWSDISALTHGLGSGDGSALQSGRIEGFYKWSDRNHPQHSIPSTIKPVGRSAASFYKWSDINSLTHN
jgi:hypothetical protein